MVIIIIIRRQKKKGKNIFFCWLMVETGLGAHLCHVEKKNKMEEGHI